MGYKSIVALCGIVLLAAACSEENSEPTVVPLSIVEETDPAETGTPAITATATQTSAPTATQSTSNNAISPNCTPRTDWVMTYTVKAGETLSFLADWAGTTVNELARGNCIADPNSVRVGQIIRVPIVPSATPIGYVSPTPLPTSSGPLPQINSFTSNVTEANTGDSLTISWDVQGATQGIYLRREYWDSTVSTAQSPQVWENLAAKSSQTVTMSSLPQERFFLVIYGGDQQLEKEIVITNKAVPLNIAVEIVSFTGQLTNDKIALAWEVKGTGLASVSIRTILPDSTFGQWYNDQPLTGSMTIDIPADVHNSITFMLMPITTTGAESLPYTVIQAGKHQITLGLP